MNSSSVFTDLVAVLRHARDAALAHLPSVLGALIILLLGFVVAYVAKKVTVRLTTHAPRLIPLRSIRVRVQDLMENRYIARTAGALVFWIVMFLFLTAATETLGLPIVTTWISGLAGYLPKVLSGVLIVAAGAISGIIVKDVLTAAATSARVYYASALGQIGQVVIVLVSVLVGLDQIGIDVSLLQGVVMIALGAIFLGASLAFGLGAKLSVSNILASHYLQKRYKVGDAIRIGERRGTILAFLPDAVVLETEQGKLSVPALLFHQEESELLVKEESA